MLGPQLCVTWKDRLNGQIDWIGGTEIQIWQYYDVILMFL